MMCIIMMWLVSVWALRTKDIRTGDKIQDGDVLIGLPSTGVHSNGFSLVRKVLFKDAKLDPHQKMEELNGRELGDVLLEPTRIYVRPVLRVLEEVDVHGMSHITGGGFFENIPGCSKTDRVCGSKGQFSPSGYL